MNAVDEPRPSELSGWPKSATSIVAALSPSPCFLFEYLIYHSSNIKAEGFCSNAACSGSSSKSAV